uniref:Uncharacterized protein n=1 Tax=Rhizophora mucronata TaxID=61149 RepID=A0A2P2QXL4_RHIMU
MMCHDLRRRVISLSIERYMGTDN